MILILFLAFSFVIVFSNKTKIGDQKQHDKIAWFSSYYEDLKTNNIHQLLYYPYFLARRTVVVISLGLFMNYQKLQITLLIESS